MDTLELIARSEWPIVVIGALFLFRKPIHKLTDRLTLTKIEAWGVKAEFKEGLEKIETLALAPEDRAKADKGVVAENGPHAAIAIKESIGPSPEATVFESWRKIELEMQLSLNAMEKKEGAQPLPAKYRADEVARLIGLSNDEAVSLRTLQKLRDSVAQSGETLLTWDEAIRFSQAVERLLISVRRRKSTT